MTKLSEEQTMRLADVAAASRDAWDTARVHSRKLEDAVLEAIDVQGASAREVARAIGVTPTRVYAIVRSGYRHDDEN